MRPYNLPFSVSFLKKAIDELKKLLEVDA